MPSSAESENHQLQFRLPPSPRLTHRWQCSLRSSLRINFITSVQHQHSPRVASPETMPSATESSKITSNNFVFNRVQESHHHWRCDIEMSPISTTTDNSMLIEISETHYYWQKPFNWVRKGDVGTKPRITSHREQNQGSRHIESVIINLIRGAIHQQQRNIQTISRIPSI